MDTTQLLTPAEIERRVFAWLQGRPAASMDEWRELGEEGVQRLYAIAATPRTGVRANRLRGAALAVLGQLGDPEHIDVLLEVFDDPEAIGVVRCGAIEGLGFLGMPRALPLLQSQAYHADFRVRLYSVTALARMQHALTRRILGDVSTRDPHPQVRRAAAAELDRLRAALTVAPVVRVHHDSAARTIEGDFEAPSGLTGEFDAATQDDALGLVTDRWEQVG